MKFILSFICLTTFLLFGCTPDNNSNITTDELAVDDFYIQSYHGMYGQNGNSLFLNTNGDNLVKFEYDAQNRIIFRIGDIVHISGGGGYLHDSLYTEVTYENDKATLTKKIHPFGGLSQVRANYQTITFDSRNRMVQKINFLEHNNPEEIDTTRFTYLDNKLVKYRKTYTDAPDYLDYSLSFFIESDLYYTNDNLDSIVTIKTRKFSDEPYIIIAGKEVEIFSQYDTAKNPFRKLSMFDETFFRSLSKNNYSDYRKIEIPYAYPDSDYTQPGYYGPRQETEFQTWSFAYDAEGEWIYDEL